MCIRDRDEIRKDLNEEFRIVEGATFERLRAALVGAKAEGGPALKKGTEITDDYLDGLERGQWFKLRMAEMCIRDSLVKDTPRVMGFIGGTADKPAPITDREADAILRRVADSGDKPKPKTLFEPGETVRVIDGPFADFNGVVEEVNYEKSRIQVAVLIFGRSTPVELEFSQVEKV